MQRKVIKLSEVKRVQIDMPQKSFSRLKDLKEETEAASYGEVVKNALRLYEAAIAQAKAGNSFFVKTPNGEMKEFLVF